MKKAIAEASELDTALIFRPLKNTARVYKNRVATKVNEIEREKGQDMKFDYIVDLVAGVKGRLRSLPVKSMVVSGRLAWCRA